MSLMSIFNIVLVAFAFGFVIFWHELGHFLAARWAGVRVEQFAVGMGNAIFSWRKGIGFRAGNTQAEFEKRVNAEFERRHQSQLQMKEQLREPTLREQYDIARDIGLGETDYRFNWIPIGGYVKPTGQDDLRPAKEVSSDDPHSFGAKPVYKRMVIISAGVIMNVILAFALYVALFLHGFRAPPTVVGQVVPGSPAQLAGLKPGDEVLELNGWEQSNYPNFQMDAALLRVGEPAKVVVRRPGVEKPIELTVSPVRRSTEGGLPIIGVQSAMSLTRDEDFGEGPELVGPDIDAMPVGSRVVAVNGQDVSHDTDAHVLNDAMNAAAGGTVNVTIRNPDGTTHPFTVRPAFVSPINPDDAVSLLGMQPRVEVAALIKDAPAQKAGVLPRDVVVQIGEVGSGEGFANPPRKQFMDTIAAAVKDHRKVRLVVERDGQRLPPFEIDPASSTVKGVTGLGVLVDLDLGRPVITATVADSPAADAQLQSGETITAVAGKPVNTWADVIAALRAAPGEAQLTTHFNGKDQQRTLKLDDASHKQLAQLVFDPYLPLSPLQKVFKTSNPLTAAKWGIIETRGKLLQVYVTLRRVIDGSVALSNMSGPIGIFTAGKAAATRGIDWLIWFTALISANLAVVNFLPIPIVDGGLFTFLCIEKITGRPPSPKVQAGAQIVGIVLLGSLFLFVTYHDILRSIG